MTTMRTIKNIWHTIFLEERPSISLSLFRIVVALTVGLVVIPTLVNLPDNYFATAFKTVNPNFFTPGVLELVAKSPDAVVVFFTIFFFLSWFFFLIGFCSQVSCILMTFCCYYFYALNSFHVGTLSWDILLVTVFMMCVTGYHGDYFSADCLMRKETDAYKRKRPFFVQRLLQMQLAATFFYTALYKTTGKGNWLIDNPIHYLVNYPPEGVVKWFLFREWFQDKPEICYLIGLTVIIMEFTIPFLLFIPRTRAVSIVIGILFQVTLVLTLDVPATFFWLFPPMFLLFIPPESIIRWVETRRTRNELAGRDKLLYDGKCTFCQESVRRVLTMDLFGRIENVDFHTVSNPTSLHSNLTKEKLDQELQLIEDGGELSSGFFAFRRLCHKLPMLYPLLPLFYFPGSGFLGPALYRLIAKNRYLFRFGTKCNDNACHIHT